MSRRKERAWKAEYDSMPNDWDFADPFAVQDTLYSRLPYDIAESIYKNGSIKGVKLG